jgi:hypothetical protein
VFVKLGIMIIIYLTAKEAGRINDGRSNNDLIRLNQMGTMHLDNDRMWAKNRLMLSVKNFLACSI